MRRKPVLFLLGILAAIVADYVVEAGLLALGVSSRAAWIAGAAAFAMVWGTSFWFTLHLRPRPQKKPRPEPVEGLGAEGDRGFHGFGGPHASTGSA